MTEFESLVIEKLTGLDRGIVGLKHDMTHLDGKVAGVDENVNGLCEKVTRLEEKVGEIDGKVTGLGEYVVGLDKRLTAQERKFDYFKQHINAAIEELRGEITKIKVALENDLSKKIDIIGEGDDFLKQRLNDALHMEDKREVMELDIVNLRIEVRKIKEHLSIA